VSSARTLAVLGFVLAVAAGPLPAQSEGDAGADAPPVRASSRTVLPEIDFYFPEGDLDMRLARLVKNAFFQGQVRYNFVKGDILALLRYRYYARERIWQIGVFDEINFDRLERLSNDFQRSRGGLVQVEIPQSIDRRAFFLAEADRLTSNKREQLFSTDQTNTFVKLGYQIGTPDDSRSNAIVGESRSRVERLFSAYRNIGPGGFGLTGALTWSFDDLGGDFRYLRLEVEGLKRWQGRRGRFAITRLHLGAFPASDVVRPDEPDPEDRLSIPLDELFRLDGRERLKGLDDEIYGTEEIHATLEWFIPWFTEGDRQALKARWENWYWVAYAGVGNIGFESAIFSEWKDYVPDLGFGFESSFRVGRYTFFLSAVAAHALDDRGGLNGRVTLKSSNR
jgi:hypothetical protein